MHVNTIKLANGYALIRPNRIILGKTEEELITRANAVTSNGVHSSNNVENRASLVLIPTMNCNLRCTYCYSRGGESIVSMSKDTAKRAIDYIRNSTKSDTLMLSISGGGEPLVNFDVVKFSVELAKSLFKNVIVVITTNGVLTEEKIKWIKGNCNVIKISHDGLAHKMQRTFADGQDSAKLVEKSIAVLVNSSVSVIVQCVITEHSAALLKESIKHLYGLGVRHIKLLRAYCTDWTRGNIDLNPEVITYVSKLLEMLDMVVSEKLGIKIDTTLFSRPDMGAYCGVRGANFIVTPEGHISSCPEVVMSNHKFAKMMLYAKLTEDGIKIDHDKFNALKKFHFSNYEQCNKCAFKLICKAGCTIKNVNENELLLEPSKAACKTELLFLPQLLSRILDSPEYTKILAGSHVALTQDCVAEAALLEDNC